MAPTQSRHAKTIMKDSQVELLLTLVQRYTALWKKSSKEYEEADHDVLWTNISIAMKIEKSEIINKWKNLLRDFRAALLEEPQTPSGAEATVYKPRFKWWQRMQFVRDEAAPRKSKGNLQAPLQNQAKGETSDEEDFWEGANEENLTSNGVRENQEQDMTSSKSNNPNAALEKQLGKEPQKTDADVSISCNDEWDHYLMSLLPHVRHLRDAEILLFRGCFAEIVMQNAHDVSGLYANQILQMRRELNGRKK